MTRFDITVSIDVMLTKLHSVVQHSHTLGPVVVSPRGGTMALQNWTVRENDIESTTRDTLHSTQELLTKKKLLSLCRCPSNWDSDERMTRGGQSRGGSELISPK